MEDCKRCAGNGEIVTDWDRYLHGYPGDKGDEAVADCPDCDGTGASPDAPESRSRTSTNDGTTKKER